jgi:hypothetical protein
VITAVFAFAARNWQALAILAVCAALGLAYHLRIVHATEAGYAQAQTEQRALDAEALRLARKVADAQRQDRDVVAQQAVKNAAVLEERLRTLKDKVYGLQIANGSCAVTGGLRDDYNRAIHSYGNGPGDGGTPTAGATSPTTDPTPVTCTDLASTAAHNAEVGSYCCGVAKGWQRWWAGQLQHAGPQPDAPR